MRVSPYDDIKSVPRAPGVRLRGTTAMLAAAAVLTMVFTVVNLPGPLYVIYRQRFHFSELMLTVAYAVYMLGSLIAMVLFGRISDQIGRRPVLYLSIVLSAVAAIVFIFTFNTATLLAARIVSGLGAGLTATACTAWIAELPPKEERPKAALFSTGANLLGLALGPLLAGLIAQYAILPLRLPYIIYLAGLIVPALAVWTLHETVREPKPLDEVSLWPRIGVPNEILAPFIAPAVTAFAAFALMGFYSALIPTLLKESLHIGNHAVGGAVTFFMFVCGVAAIASSGVLSSRAAMFTGLGLLIPAVALLVLAQQFGSMPLLLAASAIGGASGALGYRGSLAVINEIAPQDRRAEIVATYLICCYIGVSVPVIGIGVITGPLGAKIADMIFAGALCVLAVIAIVTGWKYAED
ncbi:MAG TPA: MFS transporter [Pseudolabrys sp.]|nr:MFS transporter [Pseudolabrys sp.]